MGSSMKEKKQLGLCVCKFLFAVIFIGAGFLHFLRPEFYLRMMPPYLPAPWALVMISGAAEVILGFGLFFRKTQCIAAWGIILLLIAVFPANVQMAMHPELFPQFPKWGLYVRLPLQFVLIGWAYCYTHDKKSKTD